MNRAQLEQRSETEEHAFASSEASEIDRSYLMILADWIDVHKVPFLVSSIGMIAMLLWAGSYKLTAPGAEGIAPLVVHSPLTSWEYRLLGPYLGSDLIGATEIVAAVFYLIGYLNPKAGIVAGIITTFMFFTTSSMLITTPGSLTTVNGIKYMSFLGLFLYKDVIALGTSLYLIACFGKRALAVTHRV